MKKSGPKNPEKVRYPAGFPAGYLFGQLNLVRPMRFERTAYRVGVIRPSGEKGCIHAPFGSSAQILPLLVKNEQSIVRQRIARY